MVQGPRGPRGNRGASPMAPAPVYASCLRCERCAEQGSQGWPRFPLRRNGARAARGWVGSAWLSPVGQPAAALLVAVRSPHPGLLNRPSPCWHCPPASPLPPRMPTQRRGQWLWRGLEGRTTRLRPGRITSWSTCPQGSMRWVGGGAEGPGLCFPHPDLPPTTLLHPQPC